MFLIQSRNPGVAVLCIALTILMCSCSGGNDQVADHKPQANDTAYTAEAAMNVYAYEPERALTIIDSALLLDNIDYDLAQMLRAKVFSQSLADERLDSAQTLLLGLLNSSYTENKATREKVYDLLLNIAYKRQHLELLLHWGALKVECCRELGHETEALRTEAEIAFAHAQLGEEEKGLAKINHIIAKLDGQRSIDKMDACVVALKRKALILNYLGRLEETVSVAQHAKEILDDYREHYADYADDSFRFPKNEEEIQQYCDFYIAQIYSCIANLYAKSGKTDSARHYLAFFEQNYYGQSYIGRKSVVPTYCLLGDYDKMDEIYAEMAQKMGTDTLNNEYADMLLGWAKEAEAQGNHRIANAYLHRYDQVKQQLNDRLLKSRAYDISTRYQLHEEQLKAENEQRRAQNRMYMVIVGFTLFLIAIGTIVLLWILYRKIKCKNRVLVEQIAETVRYKNDAQNLTAEDEALVATSTATIAKVETATKAKLSTRRVEIKNLDKLSNEQLFKFLSEAIRQEQLFTNPNFGRQMLMDRFNVSERRIGAAFAHGSEHNSLPDFVRELRLEYASRLLTDHAEMSVSDVATAAGFSSLSVFSREFKRKFDISPSFYRQQISESKM